MEDAAFSAGDTAWILTASALVLMMTVPGLALFYGGMVRRTSVLSTLMHSLAAAVLVTVTWSLVGYSLALTGEGAFIGGLDRLFLAGLAPGNDTAGLPEPLFLLFQLTFAIITVAIISGAAAERMSFKAWVIFVPV